ncbi:MAG TPA: PspC domain-containing protein [Verrucomicrobiae bacterium]|jgi:phage shock protein PspC (stress-responsive transcriptional regulator)|nr:PspC domain-containing protein [Verrucomicrobiae bacterium]
MNKVITINLGGNAYQLEEVGYDALRAYLETAAARLKNNPDRDEILQDIERAISEKFRALLSANKNVVETNEINAVIAEMGPIETNAEPAPGSTSSASASGSGTATGAGTGAGGQNASGAAAAATPKRLYRIPEGAMFAGVCNGIGAYFNIDPTFIRLAFAFSMIVWGAGLMLYIILMFVIPEATTPEEKAAASGDFPPTAQEFIRRAKEGYYQGMKGFPNYSWGNRAWYRQWRRQMRAQSRQWRYHWWRGFAWNWKPHAPAPPPPPLHPAMGFTLPILSMLHGIATVLWICALISLLSTGTIFGVSLPDHVPVWAAAALLFMLYGIIVAPMKGAKHAYYWSLRGMNACDPNDCRSANRAHWAHPVIALMDTVVGIVVAVVLLCLAIEYFPELRHALESFPAVAQQAVHDVKSWWHGN